VTKNEFARLVRDDIGLDVDADDLDRGFDELDGWDSVHLLAMAMMLERRTGAAIALPDVLQARNLASIYELVNR
jgi:acyl carrier protein